LPSMTLRKIIDGIFVSDDGSNGGNHGAIVLDDEIIMIDSGMIHPKSAETKKFLESETGLSIQQLVFTHIHGDHVLGAQAFEPVKIICSKPMLQRFEKNLQEDWLPEKLRERYAYAKDDRPELWEAVQSLEIRLPDTVFEDQMKIGKNDELTVSLLGGHTSGSSVVISPRHDVVFVGDLIFNGQFPYGGDPTCEPDRWIQALEEVHALGHDVVIPGHGPVCGLNGIAEYVEALSELRANVKEALQTGISEESFVARDMVPEAIRPGMERFDKITLEHWFNFYG
ncbi:MAG: MBL fold metallo-hydrolase, partial [Candidatus Thorarchaeota archaeon]